MLVAHYEIVYEVAEARASRLSLFFPATTPAALVIRALDKQKIKEYVRVDAGAMRRWDVWLEEPARHGPAGR